MPCWKFCDNVAGAGRWAWGGKKDFLEDVSVCVRIREKLIGENLRGLRNTAWTTDTPTAKLSYFVCICVGAQDLFWGWRVDCFPSSVWEQAAACRRGRIWGLGLRLFSDWVRSDIGSSFLCREKIVWKPAMGKALREWQRSGRHRRWVVKWQVTFIFF